MKKRTVLITGANGFVGKRLLAKLAKKRDVYIRSLIRRPSRGLERICDDIRIGDLRYQNHVKDIAKGMDIVIHLASVGDINATSPITYEKYKLNNATGTKNLLVECSNNKIKKFIHFSSVSVYGDTDEAVITEKTKCRPKTPYERTKYESEKLVAKLCMKNKIQFVILRPSTVYGDGDKSDIRKLASLVKLGIAPIIGDGQNLVHMIHIDDIVAAALKATKVKKSGVYILNSESLSVNEIINILGKGKKTIKIKIPANVVKRILRACEQIIGRIGITLPFSSGRIEKFSSARRYATELAEKELGFKPHRHFKDYTY